MFRLLNVNFVILGHTDGSPFPSAQSMTSPATANWPGSPGMPRPSPARPGQSPGGHSALHSPEQLKSGIYKILWGQNAKMRIRK